MKMRSKIVQVFPSDNNWSALFKEDGNFSSKKVYFWCCREEKTGSQDAGAFLVMNGVCKNDEGILAEVYENPEEFCSYIHLNDDSQFLSDIFHDNNQICSDDSCEECKRKIEKSKIGW